MNKIRKLFKALTLIITQPSLLNKLLDDADVNKQQVIANYQLPLGFKTIDICDLFPDFHQTVKPYCSLGGEATPIDLALLKALAASKKDCNYFEIGTWRGESVTNVATVAKNCVTLNLPDEEMLKMGLDKNYVNAHRFFSKDKTNIEHIQANSLTFNYDTLKQKFDLIFIDGDHHYLSVKHDTTNVLKLLNDDSSIIVWHDYGNTPNDIRWDVLRGILDGVPISQHKYLYRVSNSLCAIYTKQPIKAAYPTPFSQPEKYFSFEIKTIRL